jgi:hypothetical protein
MLDRRAVAILPMVLLSALDRESPAFAAIWRWAITVWQASQAPTASSRASPSKLARSRPSVEAFDVLEVSPSCSHRSESVSAARRAMAAKDVAPPRTATMHSASREPRR